VSVEKESQEYDTSFSGLPTKLDIKKISLTKLKKNSLHRRLKEERNDLEMKCYCNGAHSRPEPVMKIWLNLFRVISHTAPMEVLPGRSKDSKTNNPERNNMKENPP